MSTDDDGVIDAEIVDSDNLPAVQVSTNPRMDYPRWSEEWWQLASPEVQARRCVAHKTNGDRCLKAAIKGATVCRTHGGATRHIRNAARVRLENAADLMAKQLLGIALTADSEAVKLAAIKDSLDRAGLKPPAEVVLSQGEPSSPFEQVWDSIGGTPGDESQGVSGDYGSAGHHAPPAPAYADIGYADAHPVADEHREPFSDSVPPREARPPQDDRDAASEPAHEARRTAAPARPEGHITGLAAIQMANQANRQAGTLPPLRELESPHKRYRQHRH